MDGNENQTEKFPTDTGVASVIAEAAPEPETDTIAEARTGITEVLKAPDKTSLYPRTIKESINYVRYLIKTRKLKEAEQEANALLAHLSTKEQDAGIKVAIVILKRQLYKIASRGEVTDTGTIREDTMETHLSFFRERLADPKTGGREAEEAAFTVTVICLNSGKQAKGVEILEEFLRSGQKHPGTAGKIKEFIVRMRLQRATSLSEATVMRKILSANELLSWVRGATNRHHARERILILEELMQRQPSELTGIDTTLSTWTLSTAYEEIGDMHSALKVMEESLVRPAKEAAGTDTERSLNTAGRIEKLKAALGFKNDTTSPEATQREPVDLREKEHELLNKCLYARNKGRYETALDLANQLLQLQQYTLEPPNTLDRTRGLIKQLRRLIRESQKQAPKELVDTTTPNPPTGNRSDTAVIVSIPTTSLLSDMIPAAAPEQTPAPQRETLTILNLQEELMTWLQSIQAIAKRERWEIETVTVQKGKGKTGEIQFLMIPERRHDELIDQFAAMTAKYGDTLMELLGTDIGNTNLRGMLTNLREQLAEGKLKTKGRILDDILRVLAPEN